jgi:transcriptional regulator with XRE-family HTH domain
MSMKKTTTGFAGRLRFLRESAGLTQQQLAERAGLNRHGLAKLEQGVGEPHWPTVIALAKALGVTCEAFMNGETDSVPPHSRGRPPKATPSTPPAEELEQTQQTTPPANAKRPGLNRKRDRH